MEQARRPVGEGDATRQSKRIQHQNKLLPNGIGVTVSRAPATAA